MKKNRISRTAGALALAVSALGLSAFGLSGCSSNSTAAAAPSVLTVGTLYSSLGQFAASSQAEFAGLEFWKNTVNAQGGIYVNAYGKTLKVVIKAYDDQSNTSLALKEYQQLITQDHVNLLVADFGTVLTSVGVPVAQENQTLLFDPTATTPSFFTESIFGNGNPDLVLTSLPSSAVWPVALANFVLSENIKSVAVIQDANAFDAAQASTVEGILSQNGIVPVANVIVPTTTTDYSAALQQVAAANPDAVLEFGYGSNDQPFLQSLAKANLHFKMTFDIFPGENLPTYIAKVPAGTLSGLYTYFAPPLLSANGASVNYGMTTAQFVSKFAAANPQAPPAGFLNIAGYQAGLIMQDTVKISPSLSSYAMKATLQHAISGHIQTLEGKFVLDANGSQCGLFEPIAQINPDSSGNLVAQAVYPPNYATAPAVFPVPGFNVSGGELPSLSTQSSYSSGSSNFLSGSSGSSSCPPGSPAG